MEYDEEKVAEAVLALLYLNYSKSGFVWKGHDWDALGLLHEKGLISDPIGKAKSVYFSEEGLARGERLFAEIFGSAKKAP